MKASSHSLCKQGWIKHFGTTTQSPDSGSQANWPKEFRFRLSQTSEWWNTALKKKSYSVNNEPHHLFFQPETLIDLCFN